MLHNGQKRASLAHKISLCHVGAHRLVLDCADSPRYFRFPTPIYAAFFPQNQIEPSGGSSRSSTLQETQSATLKRDAMQTTAGHSRRWARRRPSSQSVGCRRHRGLQSSVLQLCRALVDAYGYAFRQYTVALLHRTQNSKRIWDVSPSSKSRGGGHARRSNASRTIARLSQPANFERFRKDVIGCEEAAAVACSAARSAARRSG